MANPTSNYSFQMPTSSDLVTDLPADFEVFGQAVDTRLKALQPGTTLGDLAYSSSTANTNTRLPIGSTGQVLTVSGGVPSWATASAGGMTLIASINASAATSLSFTSIPSTYKHLLLTTSGTQSANNTGWGVRFNNNSNNDYSAGGLFDDLPTNTVQVIHDWNTSGFGTNGSAQVGIIPSYFNSTYGNSIGEMWVYDYTDASNQKTVRWSSRGLREISGGAYGRYATATGTYEELAAINRIDLIRNSTQTYTGIVRLYGVS